MRIRSYYEYTEMPFNHLSDNLDLARDVILQSTKGKLTSEMPIRLEGYAGRALQLQGPNGSTLQIRYFLIKTRIYLAQVGSNKIVEDNALPIDAFLNSFRINVP